MSGRFADYSTARLLVVFTLTLVWGFKVVIAYVGTLSLGSFGKQVEGFWVPGG